jgi:hypothetical protein
MRAAFADIGAGGDRLEVAGIDAQIREGAIIEPVELLENRTLRQPRADEAEQAIGEAGTGRGTCSGGNVSCGETHGELLIESESVPPWLASVRCAAVTQIGLYC